MRYSATVSFDLTARRALKPYEFSRDPSTGNDYGRVDFLIPAVFIAWVCLYFALPVLSWQWFTLAFGAFLRVEAYGRREEARPGAAPPPTRKEPGNRAKIRRVAE